ncbi:MAG: hypothetical protein A3K19_08165 [Lentisphaerae bacterium RIFOXYB12_FULL_65_16]|nr:MAG: hypothetical protein A3K18_00165 [Lentisphaerae bacterium RIFOXYA12_64_32]OGV89877.1 MAG: hypothetical protein A3K19_08165 [Lentisphaerae bacterium RIFOXYB12_FULL_65_16]
MIVGGAQENTLLTVRGLMDKGHDVVLVSGPSLGPEGRLLEADRVPGLKLVEEPNLVRQLNPIIDLKGYMALRRYFLAEKFDVVHTHSSKAGVVGRLAAHAARVPLVIHTVHGQAFHPFQSWWLNWLYITAERVCARRSHRVFAVAQAMVDQCVAAHVAPPEKYRVIYSGMDIDAFVNARPEPDLRQRLGIPPGVPVVGKIARLFELKGHEYLIAAAPDIVREFPEVRFLLVGDGVLRDALQREIRARNLQEHFVFTGLVPPAEVCRYTALMDVLVHLSLREGLPRTVVQALAAGIPAVGFALDGTPEVIVDGRTGILCPPKDIAAVREAVLKLLRNPLQRKEMGCSGQAFVQERFSWRRMADLIEAQYYECLGTHSD